MSRTQDDGAVHTDPHWGLKGKEVKIEAGGLVKIMPEQFAESGNEWLPLARAQHRHQLVLWVDLTFIVHFTIQVNCQFRNEGNGLMGSNQIAVQSRKSGLRIINDIAVSISLQMVDHTPHVEGAIQPGAKEDATVCLGVEPCD